MVRLSRFKAAQAETGGIMVYEGTDKRPIIFTRAFTPSVCKTLGQNSYFQGYSFPYSKQVERALGSWLLHTKWQVALQSESLRLRLWVLENDCLLEYGFILLEQRPPAECLSMQKTLASHLKGRRKLFYS